MDQVRHKGLHFSNGEFSVVDDLLAVEVSLNIALNHVPFTVTMRSPGNDAELITGLLFTEEVYRDAPEKLEIEISDTDSEGNTLAVNVAVPAAGILKDFSSSRNLISASSCGLCGRTSFEDTLSKNRVTDNTILTPERIELMFGRMNEHQKNFQLTGGTHAAAAFTEDGSLLSVMEDIGRHNAVDKVIGDLIIRKKLGSARCLLVSGRLSYEIVNKCSAAGIPFLASVSAPSNMAVEMASDRGITLMAFCRKNKLTIYSHPEKVLQTRSTF